MLTSKLLTSLGTIEFATENCLLCPKSIRLVVIELFLVVFVELIVQMLASSQSYTSLSDELPAVARWSSKKSIPLVG